MSTQPKLPTLWGVVQAAIVVFGLLLVLAYFFDPFANSGRNRNYYNTGCMTNLNQIGRASLVYLDDNNGYYWSGKQPYTRAMWKYCKGPDMFRCRADKRTASPTDIDPATGRVVTGRAALRASYLCNSNLWANKSGKLKFEQILVPSKFVLVAEDNSGDGSKRACLANPNFASAYHAANQTGRHDGEDNYVMADTHVKSMKGGKDSGIAEGSVTYNNVTWNPAGDTMEK